MRLLTKISVLAFCVAMGAMNQAKGEEIGGDLRNYLGEVVAGQSYSLSQKGDYYTYSPKESGLITVQTNFDGNYSLIGYQNQCNFFLYDISWAAGKNVYTVMTCPSKPEIIDGGYRFVFNVKGEESYIFGYGNNLNTPLDFEILEVEAETVPAELTFCYPTPGTTFDTALGTQDITLEFDQNVVSVESVTLDYTNKEGQKVSMPVTGNYRSNYSTNKLAVRIRNIFQQAKEKADFEYPFYVIYKKLMCTGGPVTSTNIREGGEYVKCSEEGDITIEYQFMEAVKLVNYNMPSTLYSYYAPGTPAGIATFEFSGPIVVRGAEMVLMMGYHPATSEGGEDLDPSWDINYALNEDKTVLTLNFTGINFGESLQKNYDQATIIVGGIRGENGLFADMNDGSGYLEFFPNFVPNPYEEAEIPNTMTEEPTVDPRNYSLLRDLPNVVLSWEEPVELISGIIPQATVTLDVNPPQMVYLFEENGSLVLPLGDVYYNGNSFSGQCEIEIPKGIVKNAEGLVNDRIFLAYTLSIKGNSSVERIEVDKTQIKEAYNLNGQKVKPSEIHHGIFIINGKKVLVK